MSLRGRAAVLLAAALLCGAGSVGLVVAPDVADVVPELPAVVVPNPTDRDVLAASAGGAEVSVQRDGAGTLVLVVPGRFDPRTVEQSAPGPDGPRAGTASGLGAAAALLLGAAGLTAARHRAAGGLGAAAAGVLGAVAAVNLV